MRAPIYCLFILLLSATFGCHEHQLAGSYGIYYDADDSLLVQTVTKGGSYRQSFTIPASTVPSNIRGSMIYNFYNTVEPDPDMYLNLIPSAQFDSLFVYTIVNGQNELRYSGVDDSDWRINVSRKDKQYHTLTLR